MAKKIGYASQILTNKHQISVLFQLSNYYCTLNSPNLEMHRKLGSNQQAWHLTYRRVQNGIGFSQTIENIAKGTLQNIYCKSLLILPTQDRKQRPLATTYVLPTQFQTQRFLKFFQGYRHDCFGNFLAFTLQTSIFRDLIRA